MEESKELQKLYGFMQAFIYITVCIEILLFVHFPFSEQIMPLLSKMAKIPIYSNILYSKLFTFFIIMVTCIGTRSKKDLELDPTKQIIFPLIFGFIMFFGSICFLFFKEKGETALHFLSRHVDIITLLSSTLSESDCIYQKRSQQFIHALLTSYNTTHFIYFAASQTIFLFLNITSVFPPSLYIPPDSNIYQLHE